MRERVNEWYSNTLYSRLNDKHAGAVVVVMQRLHENDLVGHLLSQGGWELLSFPAIAERDEEFRWATPYGQRRHVRRTGDALHSAREPRSVLDEIRKTLGSYAFAGQYQQSPAPYGGGLVKLEWFRRYEEHELPKQFDFIVQSWDTANKASELANYSACTTWGVKQKRSYLIHVLRQRLGYLELKASARSQAQRFGAKVVLIEDKASGTQLIEDLIAEGVSGITRYEPEGDKILRMSVQTASIEGGEVYLPRDAHWLDEYAHEIMTFPKGRFSDQVDSTSQALDWIKKHRNNTWDVWLNYYKRMAEGPSVPQPTGPTRTMRAPASVQSSRINDGRLLIKGPDGLFKVPEDLVPLMINSGWRLTDKA
jgi:predicted phage terminase large subunit-like protein